MLTIRDLNRVNIWIPKKHTQEKIATILSTLDKTIERTEALIKKYQHIKAGMMNDLFTRGVLPDGTLRPTRDKAPERYYETPIGWIPKEWEISQIGILFSIQLGKMLNRAAKTGFGTAIYLTNRNIQWDKVDLSNLEEMDFSESERIKFELKKDDLLVCEGGDVGRTAIWNEELKNCYYQKAIHRLRPTNGSTHVKFALRFFHFAKDCGIFTNYVSQTSIAHLTQEKLSKVPMFLPKYNEQTMISEKIDSLDNLIDAEKNRLGKLYYQKSGLMHDLLTGQVRVKITQE
jgi:type I restriction enzyme S subunit